MFVPTGPGAVFYGTLAFVSIFRQLWPLFLIIWLGQWIFCHISSNARVKGIILATGGCVCLGLLLVSGVMAQINYEHFENLKFIPFWDMDFPDMMTSFFISIYVLIALCLGWLCSVFSQLIEDFVFRRK